ncbi:MAG: AraC family transcriptional regulator [Treponema sp.]|jgi:AraC family transcriptional regulator|nr:AraC family transcriptional regulator [Treponema sp.]
MNNTHSLLEGVLAAIENDLKDEVNPELIAGKFNISSRHLHRLFKLTFNQSLGLYIRSRKLAASIGDLLNTGMNILDIALDYGFEYEQSYIRSFRREYGTTPGDLRKTGKILKITPPLNLFNAHKNTNGILFGPEIVVIPRFHVIGKIHQLYLRDASLTQPEIYNNFFNYESKKIKNIINPHFKIHISRTAGQDVDYCYIMPAYQVKTLDYIPDGFDHFTFNTSLCARFRYIHQNVKKIKQATFNEMFKAINDFMDDEEQKYFLERKEISIDRSEQAFSEEGYNLWEWFTPVIKKSSMKIPPFSPSGIQNVYKQKLPALRFIGKKCNEGAEPHNILDLLDNCQLNKMFDDIEKQSDIDYKTFFKGGDSYICLVREKDDSPEHWMGMFMPEGTEVPCGFQALDFPETSISVCSVYGKRSEVINYEAECRKKLAEEGFNLNGENAGCQWYFLRFNWRGFYVEDLYSKRLLDYCYPLM